MRIGIAGCGRAARSHLDRLLSLSEVEIVGCADLEREKAVAMASAVAAGQASPDVGAHGDHRELLQQAGPDALLIFTPHRWHYRLAMDALQAGCHILVEKPLSTNVQEATDILGLARGRGLRVAVGHQYRLCPSLIEARRLLAEGRIGPLRLVTASLAQPWLARLTAGERDWRSDPRVAGGGVLTDLGDHLIDALLWTTGQAARDVYAVQTPWEMGLDLVTAATIRLRDDTPVSFSVSGASPASLFELNFFGEQGRIRVTDRIAEYGAAPDKELEPVSLPPQSESIDGNFVAAIRRGAPLCCPADEAVETVRLMEAMMRSSLTGQSVRLS
ncbi:MAG: Gfo/Idh/MocA family oxidoreductase [Isosphaeraceae bacterium]